MATNDLGVSDVNVVSPSPLLVIIASTPVSTTAMPVDSLSKIPDTTPDISTVVNIPAGTPLTSVDQYTVPAGKYAVLRHYWASINQTPAGAAFSQMILRLTRNGIQSILAVLNSPVAGQTVQFEAPNIPLRPADKITIVYVNAALIAVAIQLYAQVDEQAIV